MSDVTLSAVKRTEFGKGPSRRLRRAHQVPAVLYGHGADPVHLTLPGHETALALKNPNVLITLQIEGEKPQMALPKAVQRDVLKGFVEHVDLIVVRRGEKVVVDIPVRTEGDPESGAVLTIEHPTLSVRADATALPPGVTVDVTGMDVGTTITAAEITLPDGVELVTDPEAAVVIISAPQVEAAAEEEVVEGEAAIIGAAGGEAAAAAPPAGEPGPDEASGGGD
jgi:large subunit ribosomal protein L25